MDGVISNAAVETATRAAMDLSLSGAGFSISLKIDNPWLAGAVSLGALSLGAFYLVCKGPAEGLYSAMWILKLLILQMDIPSWWNCNVTQR